jgi:hypothetical protein
MAANQMRYTGLGRLGPFFRTSGPDKTISVAAGVLGGLAIGVAAKVKFASLLIAGPAALVGGAIATALVWNGLDVASRLFADHTWDGSVWDGNGRLTAAVKNGALIWTKASGLPMPPDAPATI